MGSGGFPIMPEGRVVAAVKTDPVVFAALAGNWGIEEFPSPLDILRKLVIEVVMRGLKTIMESLALNIAEFLGRHVPAAAILGNEQDGRSQPESE